jgi:chromosomal replication initiator protein
MASTAALELHRKHLERRARLNAQAMQRRKPALTVVPAEQNEPELEPDPETAPPIPGAEKAFRAIKVKQIIQAVEEHCGLFPGDLCTTRRWQRLAIPRQVAMFLIYRHTKHATPGIGKIFADRDHSTVVYAVHKIHKLVQEGDDQVIGIIHAVSLKTGLPTYSYWGS